MKPKAIWITGASAGIGKSLSIKFAKNNYYVFGSARRKTPFNNTEVNLNDATKFRYIEMTYQILNKLQQLVMKFKKTLVWNVLLIMPALLLLNHLLRIVLKILIK
jgi:short-subunit dehydrogenase